MSVRHVLIAEVSNSQEFAEFVRAWLEHVLTLGVVEMDMTGAVMLGTAQGMQTKSAEPPEKEKETKP